MKTIEGLEIKNLKTFPSMEWGENGGVSCDIYFKNKKIAEYFNDGNGGCADVKMCKNSIITHQELKDMCFTIADRLDPVFAATFTEEIRRMDTIENVVGLFSNNE